MKKGILALGTFALVGLIGLVAPRPVRADFSLFIGRPGFSLFAGDPIAAPPPVIYAQPPGYYAPPVYIGPHYGHRGKHHYKHWKKHRHGHHHHRRHHWDDD